MTLKKVWKSNNIIFWLINYKLKLATPNIDNIRDKIKFEIENIINDLETLFEEKERILASPDQKMNVAKKYQNDQKIEENLNYMHNIISKFKQELESFKKKKKNVKFLKISLIYNKLKNLERG